MKYEKILDEIGMNPSLTGYKYWNTAIAICINYNGYDYKIGSIYNEIAKIYDTTWQRVERDLRHSRATLKVMPFNVNYKITNKSFLSLLVKKVKGEKRL